MIGRGMPPGPAAERPAAWRLFVAVPLPRPVLDDLARRTAALRQRREAARWQSPETWHLTLRFLGDTDPSEVPRIVDAMRATATRCPAFDVELGRPGSFGGAGRGRILWIGVSRGAAELERCAALLADDLADPAGGAGSGPAGREQRFRAHLTLAREAEPGLPDRLAEALRPGQPLRWRADRLVLYRSFLGPGGARHEEQAGVALGTGSPDGTIVPGG